MTDVNEECRQLTFIIRTPFFFFKVVLVYQSIRLHLCGVPKMQLGLEITAVFTKGV